MPCAPGSYHPRFKAVADVFQKEIRRYSGGGAVSVYHRGEPVVDLWTGTRNWNGDAWQDDTLAVSFSTTKGVVSTLLHQQAAKGLIDYDAPVADYWPEFAANNKQHITVRDLLTHRAGMYRMDHLNLSFEELLNWDTVCTALARAPADRSLAPHPVYHALTFGWLVGEVVQRVTGKSVTALTQSDIARPLGLDGFYVGTPDSEHHRVADLLMGRKPGSTPKPPTFGEQVKKQLTRSALQGVGAMMRAGVLPDLTRFEKSVAVKGFRAQKLTTSPALRAAMPGFSGVFSARSLARFYAALANGGELDGVRILPQQTAALLSHQQVTSLDRAFYTPMRWRLGYHQPFVWSLRRPPQAFGHFGYGGSGAWADPERNLSVALTVNAGEGTPWGDSRILKIGSAALKAASATR